MKVKLKIVPDNDCNANGEWIEVNIPDETIAAGKGGFKLYNQYAPKDHHVVMLKFCDTLPQGDE